jgi:hypothetical protein
VRTAEGTVRERSRAGWKRLREDDLKPGPIKPQLSPGDTVNGKILNALLRHRVAALGLENGVAADVAKALLEVRRNVLRELADVRAAGLPSFDERMALRLADAIHVHLLRLRDDLPARLRREIEDLAAFEAETMGVIVQKSLDSLVPVHRLELAQPAPEALAAISRQTVLGRSIEDIFGKFSEDARADIEAALRRVSDEGGSIDDARRTIEPLLDGMGVNAETLARTVMIGAAARAQEEWAKANEDILAGFEYLATLDDRTCLICGPDDGKFFEIGEPRPRIPRHPNCFPAGVLVRGPRFLKGYARHYEGDLLVIRRSRGEDLPVTPNHPILTRRGWVAAAELEHGDELIDGTAVDRLLRALAGRTDDQHVETPIEDAARTSGFASFRVPISTPDFHGDGTDGEVDIQILDRLLADEPEPFADEEAREDRFGSRALVDAETLARLRLPASFVERIGSAAARAMRRFEEGPPLGVTHLPPAHEHSLAAIARSYAEQNQHRSDRAARARVAFGERLLALSGEIAGSKILSIKTAKNWSGHVFNLETREGWYAANGVIASNCRCDYLDILKSADDLGFSLDVPPGQRAAMDGEVPETTTFPAWLKRQSAEVQRDVLGPTRYKAWKSGDLALGSFSGHNRIFTIDQLRKKHRDLF